MNPKRVFLLGGLFAAVATCSSASAGEEAKRVSLKIGPDRIVHPDGAQPYMFQSAKGTLVVQIPMFGLTPPRKQPDGSLSYTFRDKNGFYTIMHTVRSTDKGRTWQQWIPPMGHED